MSCLDRLAPLALTVLTLTLSACAAATPISSGEARSPSAQSVTPDNPAGDAQAPEDAALTRLLEGKLGVKRDRFNTLVPRFPDANNWRRVRIWGHKTRAAFRYGRKHYAVAMIDYRRAANDAPTACLERFVKETRKTANRYGLEVEAMRRSVRRHHRGVESVDWKKRAAERKKRTAAAKKKYAARRKKVIANRTKFLLRMKRLRLLRHLRVKALAAPPSTFSERLRRMQRTFKRVRWMFEYEPRKLNFRAFRHKNWKRRRRTRPPRKPRYGYADMPVIRTGGRFATIVDNNRYVGAAVAYESWSGTCLVQGFAVRQGTDQALADRVVQRWIDEFAPRLMWRSSLRKAPEPKDR